MKTLFAAAMVCLLATSCGHPDALDDFRQQQRKPHAVVVSMWEGSDVLAANKAVVLNACKSRGVSDAQSALIMGMAMAETTEIKADQRDAGKDNSSSANYSAINLNEDCLQNLGWQKGSLPDLNQDSNLDAAIGWVIKGFRTWGEDSFMNFHRGGRAGWTTGTEYGCEEYRDTMRAVQQHLISNPTAMTDKTRSGAHIPHV